MGLAIWILGILEHIEALSSIDWLDILKPHIISATIVLLLSFVALRHDLMRKKFLQVRKRLGHISRSTIS